MLELIVLGQIPGTNIYMSFTVVIAAMFILAIAAAFGISYLKKHQTTIRDLVQKIIVPKFRALYFRHKA